MSGRNQLFYAVLIILAVIVGALIVSFLVNNNNNCQQIESKKKSKKTRSKIKNSDDIPNDNNGLCITSKIFNCTNICDNSTNTNDKDQMLASLMLSSDNTMITYTVNYVNQQIPPKVSALQNVLFRTQTGNEFKTVKTVTNVQETENGFIINGMWAKDDDFEVLSDEIISSLQSGNMYIILNFEDKVVSGPLLAIENAGQLVSRNNK
jgi:hypothetical protein